MHNKGIFTYIICIYRCWVVYRFRYIGKCVHIGSLYRPNEEKQLNNIFSWNFLFPFLTKVNKYLKIIFIIFKTDLFFILVDILIYSENQNTINI